MMKRNSKFVVILCCFFVAFLFASCNNGRSTIFKENAEPATEGLEYLPFDGGTLAATIGNATNVRRMVIPKTHEGKVVRAIAIDGFKDCSNITELVIPNTVVLIGKSAFSGCTNLKSVKIGTSVTSIETEAFYNCSSLIDVTIPNSVTSIGDSAFSGCTGLASITIPNSVTSIGDSAFGGCSGLTSVTIPNSVTSTGDYVFSGCTGLISASITEGVISIGNAAFYGCTGLISITIPESMTSIGNYTLAECSSLTSIFFEGTKAQWNNISDKYSNNYTGNHTVHCSDGDIAVIIRFENQYKNIHFRYQQGYPDDWEITYGNYGRELRILDTKDEQKGNLCAKLFPNSNDKVSYCIYNYDTDSMMNTLRGISSNLMDPKSTYYFNNVFTEDEEKRDSFSFTSQEPEKVYPNRFEFHKVNYKFLKDGEEWFGTFYVSTYQYTKFILVTMEAEKSVWDAQQETFALMMENFAFVEL